MPRDRVLLIARCWTCDEVHEREVARRHRSHGHFSWYCASCEVGWDGPGEEHVGALHG